MQIWWQSSRLSGRRTDLRKCLQTDGQTDGRTEDAKRKTKIELSAPNLVYIYSMSGSRQALTLKSEGQRSRSHRVMKRAAGVGMHVDMAA